MIGILVDHDLIRVPVPSRDNVVIVGRDIPEEMVEPKAFAISSREPPDMRCSKATLEVAVSPGLSDREVRIAAATTVSYPLVVRGVNMRKLRMTSSVDRNAVLCGGWPCRRSRRVMRWRRPGSRSRGRTASGNVSAANFRSSRGTLLSAVPPLLGKHSSRANQNR